MKASILSISKVGLLACIVVSCTVQSPDNWRDRYQDLVIHRLDIKDEIKAFSPINIGISVETEKGGLNRKEVLSDRARKRMYNAAAAEIGQFIAVQPPLVSSSLLGSYPGWPALTFAEATQRRAGSLYASITGVMKARQMKIDIKGVTVQRMVPLIQLTVAICDADGKRIYLKRIQRTGDPTMGGSIDVGEWSLDKGMVVREKELLDLFTLTLQEALLR